MRPGPGTCDHLLVSETPSGEPPDLAPPRLERRADRRLVGGVCAGLAEHLGLEVLVVRLAFAVLISAGVGVVAYVALWRLVPQRDEPEVRRDLGQLFAYGALVLGLSLFTWGAGALNWAVWPVVAGGVGVGIIWQQAAPGRGRRWVRAGQAVRAEGRRRAGSRRRRAQGRRRGRGPPRPAHRGRLRRRLPAGRPPRRDAPGRPRGHGQRREVRRRGPGGPDGPARVHYWANGAQRGKGRNSHGSRRGHRGQAGNAA